MQWPTKSMSNASKAFALACAAGALFSPGQAVYAQGGDTLTMSASSALLHDSNLFRLPSNANLSALIGSSSSADQIVITSLAANLAKDYSLQRLELNLNVANYRYQTFSALDNTAGNYNAAWRWSVSPRLRGNLTTDRKETLNDFTDVRGSQVRNERVNVSTRLDGAYELSGAWRLFAGATETTQTNPQGQSADADTRTRSVDTGVRYVSASGNQWSYSVRSATGSYLISASQAAALIDDTFDQTDHELAVRWAMDGTSSANFRLTGLNRSHPKFGQRNYGGTSLAANYTLSLTSKLSVTAAIARELGSYHTSISNYTETDRLTLTPVWAIGAKTMLRVNYSQAKRSYLGAPTALAATASQRTETLTDATLSLDWQPQPSLTLSAALQEARRNASVASLDYQSTTTSLSAKVNF